MANDNLQGDWLPGYLKTLPREVQENICITPGNAELHYSNDIQGRSELFQLVGLMRSRFGTKAYAHQTQEYALKYRRASTVVQDSAEQSAVQREMMNIIKDAYDMGASDIHITDMGSYGLLEYRLLGEMRRIRDLSSSDAGRLVAVAFNGLGQSADAPSFTPTQRNDARIVSRRFLPGGVHSVRLHSEPVQSDAEGQGVFLAMRLLYDATAATGTLEQRLERLGFTAPQRAAIRHMTAKSGLNIIAGATGHGKSTVLKHVMESMVAERADRAYFSVEDPPEYPIVGIHQIQVVTSERNESQLSARSKAYTDAIAGAMRSDPDVIMIGEIRYPEAAQAGIDAALTGHSVWATLHASDAFTIVTRLEGLLRALHVPNPLDVICDPNVLAGLSYQRLIGQLCPACRLRWTALSSQERARTVPADVQRRLKRVYDAYRAMGWNFDIQNIHVRRPGGCPECGGLGLVGRAVAAETVDIDQPLLDMILHGGKSDARRVWMARGNNSFVDSALEMVFSGRADPCVAETHLGTTLDAAIHWHSGRKRGAALEQEGGHVV